MNAVDIANGLVTRISEIYAKGTPAEDMEKNTNRLDDETGPVYVGKHDAGGFKRHNLCFQDNKLEIISASGEYSVALYKSNGAGGWEVCEATPPHNGYNAISNETIATITGLVDRLHECYCKNPN